MMPDLGKYATTVVGAYGATILLIAILVLVSWRRSRRLLRELRAIENRQGRKND